MNLAAGFCVENLGGMKVIRLKVDDRTRDGDWME